MTRALIRCFGRRAKRPGVDPESDGKLLATTERKPRLVLLPKGERILIFERYYSNSFVQLFSISTGERLRAYSFKNEFLAILPLSDDIFASGSFGSFIAIHRISDGLELDRFKIRKGYPTAFASLGYRSFLAGTSEGEVLEMQWSEANKLKHNRTVKTCSGYIGNISVSGNRFAVCSQVASLVAVFEVDSFERVEAVHPFQPVCVHLKGVVLVAGCETGKIFVYDAVTFEVLREMQIHSNDVISVHVMSDTRCILSCAMDGSFNIQDVTTGAPLWQRNFSAYVYKNVRLSDCRLVTAFEDRIIVHSIPQNETELIIAPPTPLREAFESCISGAELPVEKCKELITPDMCRSSFDEWCCAHHLLMMAIGDGDIPKSRDYNGEISWWFENLYIVAKDVQIASDDDIRAMKGFLVQAKAMGVVEGIEPVLGALRVTKDIMTEVRALKRADILMLERVLQIEARLDRMRKSFDRYRKYMRNSQLLGVALQIIPIAGGSVAGIVSVGADVLEGLSVKDLTEYFLGFGSGVLLEELSSMSDRVFSKAASAMSPEVLEKMHSEHRLKLKEAVACCGLSLIELRELFLERAKSKDLAFHIPAGSVRAALPETTALVVQEAEEEVQTCMLDIETGEDKEFTGTNEAVGICDKAKLSTGVDWNCLTRNSLPSSWKDFEIDRDDIKGVSQEQLASLWAACTVRNDDTRQEEYVVLRDCLLSLLREEKLFADVIIDSSAVLPEELVQAVIDRMLRTGVPVTMGVKFVMRQFLCQIQRHTERGLSA